MATNYTERKWEAQLEWSEVYRQEPRRLEKICRQPMFLMELRTLLLLLLLHGTASNCTLSSTSSIICRFCLVFRHFTNKNSLLVTKRNCAHILTTDKKICNSPARYITKKDAHNDVKMSIML
jgi:hypothetical protein